MNQQPKLPKTKVLREVPPEWDEIMRLVSQIKFGEVVIKIQDNKVLLTEYLIKRKREDQDEFTVLPL